jgi:hypothetical protein
MAWSFSQPPPSFDTGFAGVPTGGETLSSVQQYLMGVTVCNNTSSMLSFSLTDGVGIFIVGSKQIAAHDTYTLPYNFLPTVGVRWSASGVGLIAKVWGY